MSYNRKNITTLPTNDLSCGWINSLEPRKPFPQLTKTEKSDWVVIGGGLTGLSFARRIAEAKPDARIIVLDAQAIGEGASSRNAGFAIANSTSGEAFNPDKLGEYKRINRINRMGIDILRETIKENDIECQWREIGKYHCGADETTEEIADSLKEWLEASDTEYKDLTSEDLSDCLGTSYYKRGIWTKGDVMLQPAALVRGLSRTLPKNVELYDYSPVTQISEHDAKIHLECSGGSIITDRLMLASNSFLHTMTPKPSHTVPLTLAGSLTRPLSTLERASIGNPRDWGVLSLHGMGATVRYTNDHRILIRNTAAYKINNLLSDNEMKLAREQHLNCLEKRFPTLNDLGIEHTWQGVICVSRNSSSLFGKLSDNIYGAGCYNASGVSKGTAFGCALADYVLKRGSKLIDDILQYPQLKWIPPKPILDAAMKAEVWRRRLSVGNDL